MIYIIFVYFIAICETKISLNITTSSILHQIHIKYGGVDTKLITDKEIILFNITKHNLNQGVRVEVGKIPNNIFLKEPTPNALYRKYKWPEVQRKLIVKSVTVLEFIKKDRVLRTHVFINNTTDTVKSRVDLNEIVENIASFTWSKKGLPEDEINFGLNIDFGYGNWSFIQKWRSEKLESKRLLINTPKTFKENGAGNNLTSKLIVSEIILLLEIEFKAHLMGSIIIDYEEIYGPYHYYSPSVQTIMKAAKIKNELLTKSLLELRYCTDARLQVMDNGTEKLIEFKPKRKMTVKDIKKLKGNKRAR